jgi:signal transduction histidine kinase
MALPEEGWQSGYAVLCDEVRARFDRSLDYARWLGREIWGGGFESVEDLICMDSTQLLRFGKELRKVMEEGHASPEGAERMFFERVASLPIQDLLAFFETQLSHFAEAAGRQIRIHHDTGDDVRVFPEFYREFFDSLTHIARNIVDHAAEPPLQRRTRGKPPELQIHIRANYEGDARDKFRLTIADDGRGISARQVSDRLKKKGRRVEGADRDIIQHVFDEDFSTRDAIDAHSGRGIGMNVIKTEVQKLGGSLEIESQEGQGTTLTVSLPVLWDRRTRKR